MDVVKNQESFDSVSVPIAVVAPVNPNPDEGEIQELKSPNSSPGVSHIFLVGR